jgi:hypothetical protein
MIEHAIDGGEADTRNVGDIDQSGTAAAIGHATDCAGTAMTGATQNEVDTSILLMACCV